MAYIKVRHNSTGKTYLLPEENFDPSRYTPLEQQAPQETDSLSSKVGGFLKGMTQPFANTIGRVGAAAEVLSKEDIMRRGNKASSSGDLDEASRLFGLAGQDTALTRGEKPELTDPLQIAKDSAAMLAWGVGPAKSVKTIAPSLFGGKVASRAASGALGGFGYSKETTPEGLVGSTVLGAGASVATGALIDKIANRIQVKQAQKYSNEYKRLTGVQKAAASEYMKQSPAAFENAAKNHKDMRTILANTMADASDDLGKGNVAIDDLIGSIEGTDGGYVQAKIQAAEKIIREGASKSNKVIDIEDFVRELEKLRSEQSVLPTNATQVAQLDDLIPAFRKMYPKGIKADVALDTLRAANEKFGKAVVQDTTGAINSQVEKRFANFLRDSLKLNPRVAEALSTQQDMIILREVLSSSRAKTASEGFRAVSTAPNAARTLSRISGLTGRMAGSGGSGATTAVGGGMSSGASKAVTGVGSVGPKVAAFLSTGSGSQPTQLPNMPPSSEGQTRGNTLESLGLNKETLGILSLLPVKEQNAIITKMITDKVTGKGGGNLQEITDAATRAYTALSDGGVNTGAVGGRAANAFAQLGLGGDQDTLDFNIMVDNIYSAIAKVRGGTALTAEEKRLLNRYLPQTGDSKQVLETKLKYIMEHPETVVLK